MENLVSPGKPEQSAVVTAPAPAATPSSLQQTQESTATDRARAANSPAAVRSLLSDLRKAPAPKPAEVTPAAEVQAEPVAEVAAEPATPASEEVPAETTEPTEPTPAAPNADDDDGGDDPISPITGNRIRLRLPEGDKVGRLAASFMRRNRDLPMEDAIARARNELGIKPEVAAAPADPNKPQLPPTVEAVDAELERLLSDEEKATVELRFEDAMKIRRAQRILDRHRGNLEREALQQQSTQAAEYETGFGRSEARAIDLYAFAGDPNSEGGKRMVEIEAALKDNDDPLYSSPDKPLRIAQMVAAELKIAPRSKTPAPAKAAVPAVAAAKKQILPGGGSRTIPPASNPTLAVAEDVAKIHTVHDLRKYLKPMLSRPKA